MPDDGNRSCKKHGRSEFVLEGRGYYRCKVCRVEAVTKRRRKVKEDLVKLFGGECIRCGYKKCIRALNFHHTNPEEKSFGLSNEGITRSFEKALTEAKKCELICANCHAEEHS